MPSFWEIGRVVDHALVPHCVVCMNTRPCKELCLHSVVVPGLQCSLGSGESTWFWWRTVSCFPSEKYVLTWKTFIKTLICTVYLFHHEKWSLLLDLHSWVFEVFETLTVWKEQCDEKYFSVWWYFKGEYLLQKMSMKFSVFC